MLSLPFPRRISVSDTPLVVIGGLILLLASCAPAGGGSGGKSGGETGGTTGGFSPNGETGNAGTGGTTGGAGETGGVDNDTTGSTEDPVTTGSNPPPTFDGVAGFPSDELFLQIVGPDAHDHVSVGGGITYIAGILFGTADKIVWQSSSGQTGEADGSEFWKTGPIALAPGDNTIVVKAIGKDGTESDDTVTLTYNPGFHFADRPITRPSGFFTGAPVDVVVSIGIRTKNIVPSSVTLWEVTSTGDTVGKIGPMVDNGDTTNPTCDEIQDDGVYSTCVSMQSASPVAKHLRVSLQVAVEGALYTVFSPIVPIEIVEPLSTADCQSLHQVQKDARALFQAESAAGKPNPAAAVVSMLKASPLVSDAGMNSDGFGVWTEFTNGVLGGINVSPAGTRGGTPEDDSSYGTQTGAVLGAVVPIESKQVLALAPFAAEFGQQDEIPAIANQLSAQQCPEFQVDGPHQNGAANLARMRKAFEYGIFAYSGHADTYFTSMPDERKRAYQWEHSGSQEILWSGQPVACGELTSTVSPCTTSADCTGTSECVITQASGASTSGVCIDSVQVDLRRGRVIMGAGTWGVHPEFFRKHAKREWPSSLVYLGGCRTLYSGTLAGALFGVGAKAIAGFTGYVGSQFASDQARTWFTTMLTEETTSGIGTLFPIVDPEHHTGHFSLFGGYNVLITEAEILNAGFEKGDVTGWSVEGDGRVIGQLGASIPVGGKFMGILSTGLGYTQQTGELRQSFCIPAGVEEMTLYWKFFSEEFLEWCGSIYQDTFQATLEASNGKITLVDVTVDDLCGAGDCSGCGGKYVGLIPSDVSFDQGGVYNTQWQTLTKNVAALAGQGPVTMRLFTSDAGDSIYDTVILVDSITFD